ncbi:MAG: FAD-dependent oxidoreductase, partial [Burkholderiales bacterium]
MAIIDIKVPDIGDFKDVAVIEVLVKPGDTVKVEQSLLTVESDKASMEIPSSHAGVVKEVKVKVGDTVNEGSVIVSLEADGAAVPAPAAAAPAPAPAAAPAPSAAPAPVASTYAGGADTEVDLVVLGAGPGGYSAAFRAADLGMKVVLIERFATLGGVCLNVGCIPSKALLHVAAVMDEVKHFDSYGITFQPPAIDLAKLKTHKEKVVGKLTGGLAAMAKMRKVTVVQGTAEFLDPFHIGVDLAKGGKQTIKFKQAIIAAGSEAVKLPFLPKDDPRVVTSTGALELRQSPKRMLIVGGGIIGLEMGTVYSTLGARLDVVEMLDGLMQGADRDLVKVWQKMN